MWETDNIDFQNTIAYTYNQAGHTERGFQNIIKHAINILNDAKLPVKLWFEISQTVTYLKNLWSHSFLQGQTPHKKINNKLPDLAYLRVIDNKTWVIIPKPSKNHKFIPRAIIYRLLTYTGTNQYILWNSESNRIIYARDVAIDEWNTIYNKIQSQIRENNDENIGNLLYESDYEIKNIVEPNKPS